MCTQVQICFYALGHNSRSSLFVAATADYTRCCSDVWVQTKFLFEIKITAVGHTFCNRTNVVLCLTTCSLFLRRISSISSPSSCWSYMVSPFHFLDSCATLMYSKNSFRQRPFNRTPQKQFSFHAYSCLKRRIFSNIAPKHSRDRLFGIFSTYFFSVQRYCYILHRAMIVCAATTRKSELENSWKHILWGRQRVFFLLK